MQLSTDVQKGDRIVLIKMNDPWPMEPMAKGEVLRVRSFEGGKWASVKMRWDGRGGPDVILPDDEVQVIARPRSRYWQRQLEGL